MTKCGWLAAFMCMALCPVKAIGQEEAGDRPVRTEAGAAAEGRGRETRQRAEPQAATTVNEDRTVTFRYRAPGASSIEIHLQTLPTNTVLQLEKDEEGTWSGTTPEALAPDIYFYHIVMDGLEVHDPSGRYFKGQGPRWGSILEVTGDEPEAFELRPDIPHGAVTHAWIDSRIAGELRGINIYTPPSYYESDQDFPVLYLLHGAGGNEETWVKAAFIDRLLDSWIADGKINELVVVITSNRISRSGEDGGNPLGDFFTKEVMPYVEKRYRIKTDRENTAVAGFSMGGGQTLSLALGIPEEFGALACLAGAIGRGGGSMSDQHPILKDAAKVNEMFPVFYVACGEQDPLLNAARAFHEELDQSGINHAYMTAPGVHAMKATWGAVEAFLHDFTKAE